MRLRFEQLVELPRERLFRFHCDPGNLALLLGRRRGFRVLRHGGSIAPGRETWVIDELCRLPVTMGFRHVALDAPSSFEEHMLHGPFARFAHRHVFAESGAATRVIDELDVRLPWWLGGELALRLLVARHLRAAFEFRQRELVRLVHEGAIS
ncbi:MAG: hypothetical protein ABL998_03685 [Planctomycetota bacterium]